MNNKPILDACCDSKMFWNNPENENVVFMDKRSETLTAKDSSSKTGERVIHVRPDIVGDFTNMPFADKTFKLVIFDPPHMTSLGANSWMAKKYGRLTGTWQEDIKKGFDECIRVLDDYGTLAFKWNEHDVSNRQLLDIIQAEPLITQKTGKNNRTIWMLFFKMPK